MKICKNSNYRQISHIFGQKKFFSNIELGHMWGIPNTQVCAKNKNKLMMKSRENSKKQVFPAYFR